MSASDARTEHKTWVQFRLRYAVLALVFVAFDMEMVFMFPWAVVFRRLGLVAFLDMFLFVAILGAALVYAWREGALDWERGSGDLRTEELHVELTLSGLHLELGLDGEEVRSATVHGAPTADATRVLSDRLTGARYGDVPAIVDELTGTAAGGKLAR